MKSKKKEQNFVGSYSLRKELSLVPSYLVLVLWVGFTAVILLWVIAGQPVHDVRHLHRATSSALLPASTSRTTPAHGRPATCPCSS